jgi:hypothetical protein
MSLAQCTSDTISQFLPSFRRSDKKCLSPLRRLALLFLYVGMYVCMYYIWNSNFYFATLISSVCVAHKINPWTSLDIFLFRRRKTVFDGPVATISPALTNPSTASSTSGSSRTALPGKESTTNLRTAKTKQINYMNTETFVQIWLCWVCSLD